MAQDKRSLLEEIYNILEIWHLLSLTLEILQMFGKFGLHPLWQPRDDFLQIIYIHLTKVSH